MRKELTTVGFCERDIRTMKAFGIEAQMKVRQELSQEHNVLARLRKVEEMQAHLTGKIMVFSAMFSALIGVVLKLMSMK